MKVKHQQQQLTVQHLCRLIPVKLSSADANESTKIRHTCFPGRSKYIPVPHIIKRNQPWNSKHKLSIKRYLNIIPRSEVARAERALNPRKLVQKSSGSDTFQPAGFCSIRTAAAAYLASPSLHLCPHATVETPPRHGKHGSGSNRHQ